jgi:hypothetical protein
VASPVADTYSAPSGVPVYGGRYGLGGRLSGEALLAGLQADGGMGTQASELSGEGVLAGVTAGGGMAGVSLPTWVPSTAWQWVDVPTTRFTDYMKDDGTGVANAVTALDPGVTKSYLGMWAFSAPTYSRVHHEFWFFGGGHANTTINAMCRWNLHTDTPNITIAHQSTPEAERSAVCFLSPSAYAAIGPFYAFDGKLYSTHSFANAFYADVVDRFVMFGLGGVASSVDGANMSGPGLGFRDVAAFPRAGSTWLPENTYQDVPTFPDGALAFFGPRCTTRDGSKIFHWPVNQGMRSFDLLTNTHSSLGGPTGEWPGAAICTNADETQTVHINTVDNSSAGWGLQMRSTANGAVTNFTVSGYTSLPADLRCFGIQWADNIGKFVTFWFNANAYNGQPSSVVSTVMVATLEITGPTTAVAELKTMTGTAPVACHAMSGMAYDPLYECILLCMTHQTNVKAFKVA